MSLPPHWMTSYDKEKGRICYVHKLSGVTQHHLPKPGDENGNKQQMAPQQTLDSITSSMSAISVSEARQTGYPESNPRPGAQYPQQNVLQHGSITSIQSSSGPIQPTIGQPQHSGPMQPFQSTQYSAQIQVNHQSASYAPGGGPGVPSNGQVQPNGQSNMNAYSGQGPTPQYTSNSGLPTPPPAYSQVAQAPPQFVPQQYTPTPPPQQQQQQTMQPSQQMPMFQPAQQNMNQPAPLQAPHGTGSQQPQPQFQAQSNAPPTNPAFTNQNNAQSAPAPAVQFIQPGVIQSSQQYPVSPVQAAPWQPAPTAQMQQIYAPSMQPSPIRQQSPMSFPVSHPNNAQQPSTAPPPYQSLAQPQQSPVQAGPVPQQQMNAYNPQGAQPYVSGPQYPPMQQAPHVAYPNTTVQYVNQQQQPNTNVQYGNQPQQQQQQQQLNANVQYGNQQQKQQQQQHQPPNANIQYVNQQQPLNPNVQYVNQQPQNQAQKPQFQYQQPPQAPATSFKPGPMPQGQRPVNRPHAPQNNGQRPPRPHAAQAAQSQQGIGTSVKKFWKGNKGKIAVGATVGGALLAGLVGAEIGDGFGDMFEGGGGCEDMSGDFGGGEDCGGGGGGEEYGGGEQYGGGGGEYAGGGDEYAGGEAYAGGGEAYADPAAGYDQSMTDPNALAMEQQAALDHQQMMNDQSLAQTQAMHAQNLENLQWGNQLTASVQNSASI